MTGKAQVGYQETDLHQRVAGHWDMLPRAVVTVLSLVEFKKHLGSTP